MRGDLVSKRFFWLKLQDGFFGSKRIKKLRKMAGGDTYVIIYLKMQLLAMNNGGVLVYTGLEQDFADELALDLDEEADNVKVTLAYLLSCGLAESSDNVNFFLPYAAENTGSETTTAQRVRECRARKALQCNNDVTGAKQITEHCNGEKEKEKEKDIDTEQEKEGCRGERDNASRPCGKTERLSTGYQQSFQHEDDFEKKREAALQALERRGITFD